MKPTADEPGFMIRPATPGDVGALVELIQSAYRGDTSRQGWTTEADLLEGQRTDASAVGEAIASGEGCMLVVDSGAADGGPTAAGAPGDVVACCLVERRPARQAHFGMFAVRPGRQGAGLGRRLLKAAERLAVARFGATSMTMSVIRQRVELIAWYERLGYVSTGERRPFPYGDERFGRPTRPDLEFAVLAKALAAPAAAGAESR